MLARLKEWRAARSELKLREKKFLAQQIVAVLNAGTLGRILEALEREMDRLRDDAKEASANKPFDSDFVRYALEGLQDMHRCLIPVINEEGVVEIRVPFDGGGV